MEIRIVIFLAFASVTVITNTLLIIFVYKAFAGLTSKVTETVSELQKSSETRQLIDALEIAAGRAAAVTESTKLKIAEFDPILVRAQENYRLTLVEVDSKLGQAADRITVAAKEARDLVAKPAFALASFAAGLSKVTEKE